MEESKTTNSTVDNTVKIEREGTVTISKKDFQGIMERITSLEKGSTVVKPKRINEHTAYLRLVNGMPVVKVNKVWTQDKGMPSETDMIEIELLQSSGEVKKHHDSYLHFLNEAPKVLVTIKNQKAERVVQSQGIVRSSNPDPVFSKSGMYGQEVDLEVVSYDYTCEVEIMEGDLKGRTITMSNNYLNL